MNDELFEQLRRDFAKEVEAHYEKQRLGPVSIRTGPNASLQNKGEQVGQALVGRLKHGRPWALSDEEKLKFGAYDEAARQAKANSVEVMREMAATQYVTNLEKNEWTLPNWTQHWRPEPVEIPKLPVDPITGQQIRNPWLEPHDFRSQSVIKLQSKRLAKWLEDAAKNNGVTASMLDELAAEKLNAERLGKVEFGGKQWAESAPMRSENLTTRMAFERSLEDPWVLSAYRHEREMGSPKAMFGHLSFRMALAKRDPKLAEIHRAAEKIHAQWQAEERAKAA
jgi:hypothetical protein